MEARMSLQARRELLNNLRPRYCKANKKQKKQILDEFVQVTQYGRKHAIALLNSLEQETGHPKGTGRRKKYDDEVKSALIKVWRIANEICSKRLIPFLPDLLEALERTGRLHLNEEVRAKLLTLCPATADQLLAAERRGPHGKTTTKSGKLLKRQIPVRTFSDWNDVVPGFFEADLVAHCGDNTHGAFLNTLVLIDIATSWTECFALTKKCELEVVGALKQAQEVLPVKILGFDSDNGSEFINHGLIDFCKEHQITFTRSRAYKKNDQAHVEERNGSVVRRTIGYDRYEGRDARAALHQLYRVLRLYVNFFQPTMRLVSKKRDGAKVSRQYDRAQTPFRRLLNSSSVSSEVKIELRRTYATLDPVALLSELEQLQDALWKHAWRRSESSDDGAPQMIRKNAVVRLGAKSATSASTETTSASPSPTLSSSALKNVSRARTSESRQYRKTRKPRKQSAPHTWRTREDPFAGVGEDIKANFHKNNQITAQQLLTVLQQKYPGKFRDDQRRTLMRRLQNLRNSGDGPPIAPPGRQTYPEHYIRRHKADL